MTKVSVIIPIYNVEPYLIDCIESILGQTYENIEIILVNDGSPDRSLSICKEYEKKDQRINIIDKPNGGVSSARNAGIDAANGEYLMFVDADDWLELDCIEKMINKIQLFNVDLVRCDAKKEINNKFTRKISSLLREGHYDEENIRTSLLPYIIAEKDFDNSAVCSCCFNLYKKSIIEMNNIRFDEDARRVEDLIFNIEYILNIKSFYYLKNKELYCIRNVPSSEVSHKYLNECFESYLYSHNKMQDIINRSPVKIPNVTWQFSNQIIFYCLISLSNEISHCNNKIFRNRIKYINQIINDKNVQEAFRNVDLSKNISLKTLKILGIKYKLPILLYFTQWLTKKVYAPIVLVIRGIRYAKS